MKTRKQHLQKLPLQKRLQAMENIRKYSTFPLFETISYNSHIKSVLVFVYDKTRQSHSYWWNIQEKYFSE